MESSERILSESKISIAPPPPKAKSITHLPLTSPVASKSAYRKAEHQLLPPVKQKIAVDTSSTSSSSRSQSDSTSEEKSDSKEEEDAEHGDDQEFKMDLDPAPVTQDSFANKGKSLHEMMY